MSNIKKKNLAGGEAKKCSHPQFTNSSTAKQIDFNTVNTAAIAAGLPVQWYPLAQRYGQSLRVGNVEGDRGSSLWICLKTGSWKDHASGEGGGDLISLCAAREGIGQNEARQKISEFLGCHSSALEKTVRHSEKLDNGPKARNIWRETVAITDTLAETYLCQRAITVELPASLRFHAGLYHWRSKKSYPAMVAAVTIWPSRTVQAIHRTWLDGARKANIKPPRMALGPLSGGSVRLAPVHDVLAVAEGIESALSFMQATSIPSWAVLSTSNYPSLILPDTVRKIIIAADHDKCGQGMEAATKAADVWTRQGLKVHIACPPEPETDFNDILREGRS